ncbi:phosphoribosyl-AMP cyclohydrolase [Sphingomonas sp.]|jgi:phosphoribosyl-AMP cyclohydrolase|uniref:phosphoribosyl-AMP cyclohydrolase n=1 Tax=Sphingomonas sp. TaxID=28214 RepID=UPI002E3539DE|nr:phosphoribosyl-AMP cyclohydrolase [Sphingomonas sp.]HEX4693839.1 phosphoribosyl-AMP cyclohydrolase [Sphingomonas sp.]
MSDSRDTGLTLDPRWDANGLITAVVGDIAGQVLMVAHMNADALRATIESGEAVFWSRSRQELWRKGATSGNTMRVREIRIDCDQDAVWLIVDAAGPACHTGEATCFFRRVVGDRLERVE